MTLSSDRVGTREEESHNGFIRTFDYSDQTSCRLVNFELSDANRDHQQIPQVIEQSLGVDELLLSGGRDLSSGKYEYVLNTDWFCSIESSPLLMSSLSCGLLLDC